jgi:hypothetical protein
MEGMNSTMIYCKNFCKYHNISPVQNNIKNGVSTNFKILLQVIDNIGFSELFYIIYFKLDILFMISYASLWCAFAWKFASFENSLQFYEIIT